jgi:hypothetical protein
VGSDRFETVARPLAAAGQRLRIEILGQITFGAAEAEKGLTLIGTRASIEFLR